MDGPYPGFNHILYFPQPSPSMMELYYQRPCYPHVVLVEIKFRHRQ
ncbi:hypothetical protein MY11210_005390 [Beauveria gryllotalpidicola]